MSATRTSPNPPHPPQKVLWVGLAACFIVGMLSASVLPRSDNIIPSVVIGFVAVAWCRLDARNRQLRWSSAQTYLTFFLYPIAVPVYLIQSQKQSAIPAIVFALL